MKKEVDKDTVVQEEVKEEVEVDEERWGRRRRRWRNSILCSGYVLELLFLNCLRMEKLSYYVNRPYIKEQRCTATINCLETDFLIHSL